MKFLSYLTKINFFGSNQTFKDIYGITFANSKDNTTTVNNMNI